MQLDSKILITGASGLLGVQVLRKLSEKGFGHLRILLRNQQSLSKLKTVLAFTNEVQLLDTVEIVYGDVCDYYDVAEATKGITHVFHCAALVSFHPLDAPKLLAINYEGTANVVNACIENQVEVLAHVSSTAAIGKSNRSKILSELDEFGGNDKEYVYGLSKHLAEREVWRGGAEGLNVLMINPSVIAGLTTDQQSSSSIYHTGKKGLSFYAPGSNAIADAEDVADVFIQLVIDGHFNERFLIFNDLVPFKDLFSHVNQLMGKKAPTQPLPPLVAGILWRVLAVYSKLTQKKTGITKDAMSSAFKNTRYSRAKLDALYPNYPWKSWKDSLSQYAPFYQK